MHEQPNTGPRTVTMGSSGTGPANEVPAVGLGCMGMSWGYRDLDRTHEANLELIREAVRLGYRLFDTSDQYGPFTNEALVGEALEAVRGEVFVATKAGLVVDAEGRTTRDGTPAHLRDALRASLVRLRTDHVDLYQLHRIDPQIDLERSWETMAEFVQDGRARAIGLSEVTVAELERARAIHPVASVQTELSLWSREALDEVLPYCRENGIVFIAYSPLGRGFLSATITDKADLPEHDWRRNNPRFQDDAVSANTANIVVPIRDCAAELGRTPAQVALAWVLAQGDNVVAIPGTQREAYLRENWAAGDIELPGDWLERLSELASPVGARY